MSSGMAAPTAAVKSFSSKAFTKAMRTADQIRSSNLAKLFGAKVGSKRLRMMSESQITPPHSAVFLSADIIAAPSRWADGSSSSRAAQATMPNRFRRSWTVALLLLDETIVDLLVGT